MPPASCRTRAARSRAKPPASQARSLPWGVLIWKPGSQEAEGSGGSDRAFQCSMLSAQGAATKHCSLSTVWKGGRKNRPVLFLASWFPDSNHGTPSATRRKSSFAASGGSFTGQKNSFRSEGTPSRDQGTPSPAQRAHCSRERAHSRGPRVHSRAERTHSRGPRAPASEEGAPSSGQGVHSPDPRAHSSDEGVHSPHEWT